MPSYSLSFCGIISDGNLFFKPDFNLIEKFNTKRSWVIILLWSEVNISILTFREEM